MLNVYIHINLFIQMTFSKNFFEKFLQENILHSFTFKSESLEKG